VTLKVADEESVLLSKATKAPAKNAALLTEYLASGASERFMELAEKYGLDLEQFL
jgi:oligoendopeptidase F